MEIQNASKEKVCRNKELKTDLSIMESTAALKKEHWKQLETSSTGTTGDRRAKQNSNSFLAFSCSNYSCLWLFPNHILGHLDHLGLSPRDRQTWQQGCLPHSLATPRAGCSAGLRGQSLSSGEPKLKNFSLLLWQQSCNRKYTAP